MDNLRGLQSVDERVENGDIGRDGKIPAVDGTRVTLKLENGDYFGARVWVLGVGLFWVAGLYTLRNIYSGLSLSLVNIHWWVESRKSLCDCASICLRDGENTNINCDKMKYYFKYWHLEREKNAGVLLME